MQSVTDFSRDDLWRMLWLWRTGKQTVKEVGQRALAYQLAPFGVDFDSRFVKLVLHAMADGRGVRTFTKSDLPLLEEGLELSRSDDEAAIALLQRNGLLTTDCS